jgi:2-desacetyl-2-hydroxyethyl bacteriochlorophyllide A dehydrogenase
LTLRAVVLDSPHSLRLDERPDPDPEPGHVLVSIAATGVCGTDVSIFSGKIPVHHPLVMGHEMVGRIVGLGEGAEGRLSGARVAVDPVISCGTCYQCSKGQTNLCPSGALMGRDRDGAFTETVSVPASNVYPLPDSIDDRIAPLIQVLTVCAHGQRTAPIFPGDSAIVIGLGVTGLLHLQIAKARGARPLIGVTRSDHKRRLAEKLGADLTIDPADPSLRDKLAAATSGRGADLVIEAAGKVECLAQAIELVRAGGHIALFGTITATEGALPFYQLYYKEITITNPRAAKAEDFPGAIALAASGAVRLEPIVSHTLSLEQADDAIHLTKEGGTLKVILDHGAAG